MTWRRIATVVGVVAAIWLAGFVISMVFLIGHSSNVIQHMPNL